MAAGEALEDTRAQILCEMAAIVRYVSVQNDLPQRDCCGRRIHKLLPAAPMRRLLSRDDLEFVRQIGEDIAAYKRHRAWVFYCYLFRLMVDYDRRRLVRLTSGRTSLSTAARDELVFAMHCLRLIYAAALWAAPFHFQNNYCEQLVESSLDAIRALGRCPVIPIRQAG